MRIFKIFILIIIFQVFFTNCSKGGRSQYQKACSLQEQGKLEEAIGAYKELIEEHKRGKWVEMSEERIHICEALLMYQKAEEKLREGEIKKARELLHKANKEHRVEYKAMYIEGRLYIHQEKLDRAEVIFVELIRKYPSQPEGHLGLGLVEERKGKLGSAILHFGKVIRYTKNMFMKEDAISGLERIGDKDIDDEMIGLIEEQLSYFKGTPKLLRKVGRHYLYSAEEPDYNKAVSYLNRALSFDDIDDDFKLKIYVDIAYAYQKSDGYKPANKYIELGLEIDPDNEELLEIRERLKNQ